MVSTEDDSPHQLSQVLSCISSSAIFSERKKQHDHPSQVGQFDSSHFHQLDGGTHPNKLLCQLALALWE